MPIAIRLANRSDASQIINAHRRSIREVCCKDYLSEQIEAWAGRDFQEVRWHQTIEKDKVWVLADELNIVYGFGHMALGSENAKLCGLYFVPEVIGMGFGRKMFEIMLAECKLKNLNSVFLTGTKTAKGFYESLGFEQIRPMVSVSVGGVPIEAYEMKFVIS